MINLASDNFNEVDGRYADGEDAYWTGYFTSRPGFKRYVRQLSGYYLVSIQRVKKSLHYMHLCYGLDVTVFFFLLKRLQDNLSSSPGEIKLLQTLPSLEML